MNELSRHIEILLLDNDCVIVPNFGGFMAHHKPAEYDDEAGLFYPPQRTLGFNPQLKLNDSLLAQSYVEAYDISYPEAVKRIENDITEIKQTIAIEGEYEFHGIGTVKKNTDSKYDFEPCMAGLLTPNLYALNTFSIDCIANEQTEDKQPQTTIIPCQEKVVHAISGTVVRNIAAAAMILLLFIFSSIPAGLGSNKFITCSVLDTEFLAKFFKDNNFSTDNSTHTTNILSTQITKGEQNIKTSTAIDNSVDTAATTVTAQKQEAIAESSNYFIVLASKVTRQGAEDFIAKLGKDGFNDARLQEHGSIRKVVYGNYPTEASAHKALTELKKVGTAFAEAWISK